MMSPDQDQEAPQEETAPELHVGTYVPTREQRETLKALSKEIFGASGRWTKLLRDGTKELITRKTKEKVPGENGEPDTEKEVTVPVLTPNGVKQFRQKYYTVESLLELLQGVKVKRDEFMAMVKAQKEADAEAKKAAELQKQVQEDLGGSALT